MFNALYFNTLRKFFHLFTRNTQKRKVTHLYKVSKATCVKQQIVPDFSKIILTRNSENQYFCQGPNEQHRISSIVAAQNYFTARQNYYLQS